MRDDVVLDFGRGERVGVPEIIYGESKSREQIAGILEAFAERGEACLVTRVSAEKAAGLAGAYDPVGRTLWFPNRETGVLRGNVTLVSAGTSDAPVVAEAQAVCRFIGLGTVVIQDVGVAGIHRLLERKADLDAADVVLCFAGFEGALPSVVAGLVRAPVIGVPCSVGYGVAEGGMAALHAMLASCAGGLLTVNIDNGCGAALAAGRILDRK